MTAQQRAEVYARLDELASEVRELAREVAMLTPPSPPAARQLPPVAA